MAEDKKKYGRTKSEAIKKGELRDAAFRKQCAAYKKRTGESSCKNMNFKNPVQMSAAEKAMAAKSKGTLTQKGKAKADETIRTAYNK
jgi:hypothetical protein